MIKAPDVGGLVQQRLQNLIKKKWIEYLRIDVLRQTVIF